VFDDGHLTGVMVYRRPTIRDRLVQTWTSPARCYLVVACVIFVLSNLLSTLLAACQGVTDRE